MAFYRRNFDNPEMAVLLSLQNIMSVPAAGLRLNPQVSQEPVFTCLEGVRVIDIVLGKPVRSSFRSFFSALFAIKHYKPCNEILQHYNNIIMIKSEELGKKIRWLREGRKLPQAELAKVIGTSREIVSNIETGVRMPKLGEISKLANFFRCSIDDLVSDRESVEIIIKKSRKAKPEKETLRINFPQKNLSKFREVFLYILNKVGAKPNIDESVLQKMLYFIDFDYYEQHEEQLIGATYIKDKYGPTPVEFVKVVDEMIYDEDLDRVRLRHSYEQTKYLPLRRADLSNLNANEISTINKVLEKLSDMNAKQIAEYSHNDIPWLATDYKEKINYEAVFYRTPPYSVRQYVEEDQH